MLIKKLLNISNDMRTPGRRLYYYKIKLGDNNPNSVSKLFDYDLFDVFNKKDLSIRIIYI